MNVIYGDKWSNAKERPWNVISESAASILHHKQMPYIAMLSENEKLKFVIDIANESISIWFFDDLGRKYLQHDFQETEAGILFWGALMFWEYEENTTSLNISMVFSFSKNGDLFMDTMNWKTNELVEKKAKVGLRIIGISTLLLAIMNTFVMKKEVEVVLENKYKRKDL